MASRRTVVATPEAVVALVGREWKRLQAVALPAMRWAYKPQGISLKSRTVPHACFQIVTMPTEVADFIRPNPCKTKFCCAHHDVPLTQLKLLNLSSLRSASREQSATHHRPLSSHGFPGAICRPS